MTQTSWLIGAAGLALHEGNPQRAAQLLGAVESALEALKAVMEPAIQHFHAQTRAAVREKVEASEFQSEWEAGGKWSLEEAVKLALSD